MAKTIIYNSDGSVASSTDTGGSGSGSSVMPFGHIWHSNATAATYYPVVDALFNQNGNTLGAANKQWQATNAGSILAVEAYEAGPANGAHSLQILKNGSVAQTLSMGTGGSGYYMSQPCTVTFAVGDQIGAQMSNSVAGNTQVSFNFTLKLNT